MPLRRQLGADGREVDRARADPAAALERAARCGWSGQGARSFRVVQYAQSRSEHSSRVPIFPAAFVRDIARPAPWTVECSAVPASARLDALEDHRRLAHRRADEAALAREGRRRALADDPGGRAVDVLAPGVVVVVVDLDVGLGAEDGEHLGDDDLAARVRVAPGELHRGGVALAEPGGGVEDDRRAHHPALVRAAVERQALREREEAGRRLVAEAARAEVHADPDAVVVLVAEQVDVVVAGADGAELLRGEPGRARAAARTRRCGSRR